MRLAPAYFVLQVGDGQVAGVAYRSNRPPRPVKLALDTDGDGLFSDENQYVGTWLQWLYPGDCFQFGPVSLRPGNAADKRGVCYIHRSGDRGLLLYTAFYREGTVLLEGKAYKVALVDSDFDGRFDRSFAPPAADSRNPGSDVFAMDRNGDSKFDFGEPGESEIMPLSRLVQLGGQYFGIEAAEDGAQSSFAGSSRRSGNSTLAARRWFWGCGRMPHSRGRAAPAASCGCPPAGTVSCPWI